MLVDFRAVIQYLPAQFNPGVRLESSAFLARAEMQLSIDAIAPQQPPERHRTLQAVGMGGAVQFDGTDGAHGAQGRLALNVSRQGCRRARRHGKFLDQSFPTAEAEQAQSDFGQRQNQRGAENEDAVFGRAPSESAPFFRQWVMTFGHRSFVKLPRDSRDYLRALECNRFRGEFRHVGQGR